MLLERRQSQAPDAPRARTRIQIAVDDLRLGMWVAELDRPWLDTPFLLRGFLVDSQVELDTLRRYCRHVLVDVERSSPELAEDVRRAEVAAPAAPRAATGNPQGEAPVALIELDAPARPVPPAPRAARVYRARADVDISRHTRERFGEMMRRAALDDAAADARPLARTMRWLRRALGASDDAGGGQAAAAVRVPGEKTTEYLDTIALEDELPGARELLARGLEVARTTAADARAVRPLQLQPMRSLAAAIAHSVAANPDALLWLARLRDEQPGPPHHHGIGTAACLAVLGRFLGLPAVALEHLALIGLLADLGKARLPRALLDKPGMLSPSEYAIVKEHVQLGLDALAGRGLPPQVEQGIAQHHERLDGSGYPRGLRDAAIGPWGRMAAIADSYAGLTAPRGYALASTPQDALLGLIEWSGSSFDERLVRQFAQAVGLYPVGSLVELSSGEVAVVTSPNRRRQLQPQVLVLTCPDKTALAVPLARDLEAWARAGRDLRIVHGLPMGAFGLRLRDWHLEGIERQAPDAAR